MRASCSTLLMAMLLILLMVGLSTAETIYIGDRLVVTIREVPEDAAQVIGTLKSDDALELLAEDDPYFHVRTADGTEGYIKKQYLTRNRPKSLTIDDLNKQIARQKQQITELKSSLSGKESAVLSTQGELSSTIEALEKELATSNSALENAQKELADVQEKFDTLEKNSGDVVSIINARESLQKENGQLTDELNSLREENAYLLRTAVIKWFLAGAGVLFVGWMVGKSSRRKRRY